MKYRLYLLWIFLCVALLNSDLAAAVNNEIDISNQIKLTRSGLVLNRWTNTYDMSLAIKNITKDVIYGPAVVSVNDISSNSIVLLNATGSTSRGVSVEILSSDGALAPDEINNVVLKFKNPKNVKFNFTTSVLQLNPTEQAKINSLQPTIAYSGTDVLIEGTAIRANSVVNFDGKPIGFQWFSSSLIKITIPVDNSDPSHIRPYPSGKYLISVDNSPAIQLTVSDLPENPNQPGQVLNAVLNDALIKLDPNQPEFQNILNDIRSNTTQANVINRVYEAELLMQKIHTDLASMMPEFINSLDPATKDLLERILIARGDYATANLALSLPIKPSFLASNINFATIYNKVGESILNSLFGKVAFAQIPNTENGDQWLDNRKKWYTKAHKSSVGLLGFSGILLWFPSLQPVAAGIGTGAMIFEILADSLAGNLQGIEMLADGRAVLPYNCGSTVCIEAENTVKPAINGMYAKLKIVPVVQAFEYTELYFKYKLIKSSLNSLPSTLRKNISDALNWAPAAISALYPTKTNSTFLPINNTNYSDEDFYASYAYLNTDCAYGDYFTPDVNNGAFDVPDTGKYSLPRSPLVCNYSIDKPYQLTGDQDKKGSLFFFIRKWPRVNIQTNGSFNSPITSSENGLNNGVSCLDSTLNNSLGVCYDYFKNDKNSSYQAIHLSTNNSQFPAWQLEASNQICGTQSSCDFSLEQGTINNIFVSLYGKLHVDVLGSGQVVMSGKPDHSITCKNSDQDCDGTFTVQSNVTISAIPDPGYKFVGWAGLDSDSCVIDSTANTCTIFMDGKPKQVLAEFELECHVGMKGPAGGIVFYITDSSATCHGLEAAPVDQFSAAWGCMGLSIPGAKSSAIGSGTANTQAIVASCNEPTAAKVAVEYSLNGYSDWYLPSYYELNIMYGSLQLKNLSFNSYWSSTESHSALAYTWPPHYGLPDSSGFSNTFYDSSKETKLLVRAIRSF